LQPSCVRAQRGQRPDVDPNAQDRAETAQPASRRLRDGSSPTKIAAAMLFVRLLQRMVFLILGFIGWIRFGLLNTFSSEGREHLLGLPSKGVLFVSNHLTYYIDVLAIHHALTSARCAPLDGLRASLKVRFVAAFETLNERGLLPRLFNHTGAVLVRRTWRHGEQEVQRPVNPGDLDRIGAALDDGWLITFPQGTTTPGAPVRKGTAHIIRAHRPIVVPILLGGFDRAFARKGFRSLMRGVQLSVRFGAPLRIGPDDSAEHIQALLTRCVLDGDLAPEETVLRDPLAAASA
jgi:1-acyl-sn-glycerol-3-phosphate acyltransferase